ncbi:MAG: hypothetical protein U1E74_04785 [Paenacidovorax caeni]
MLGAVDRLHVLRLIEALALGDDGRAVVETSDTLRVNGLSAASTLENMCAVLQRMAVLQAVPQMAEPGRRQRPRGCRANAPGPVAARRRKPSCSTAFACTDAPSWGWPLMNTPHSPWRCCAAGAFKPPGFVPGSVEKNSNAS